MSRNRSAWAAALVLLGGSLFEVDDVRDVSQRLGTPSTNRLAPIPGPPRHQAAAGPGD